LVEQHPVEAPVGVSPAEAVEELPLDRVVIGPADDAAGVGEAPQDRHRLEAVLLRPVDEPAGADVGAAEAVEDFLATEEAEAVREVLERGRPRDERAGLVQDAPDGDAHGVPPGACAWRDGLETVYE